MKAKGAKTKTCPICGKEFEANTSRKFCSDECFRIGRRDYNRQYDLKRKQAKVPTSERAGVDERLRSCHAAGQTYAQAQRAETIEKFARVEVPEAFQVITAETPEQPAGRKVMFFSKEEREALIRIEAQVETLKAFFEVEGASTGQDYPMVILGRILEQVKGLMSEADK